MARTFAAIFEDGVLKPLEDPGLAEHELVEIEIRGRPQRDTVRRGQRISGSAKRLISRMSEDFDEPLDLVPVKDLDAWSREVDELAERIPQDDFDRIDAALQEADREAKEFVRQAIEAGIRDADAGSVVDVDEVRAKFGLPK